jgi:hypothetical protein
VAAEAMAAARESLPTVHCIIGMLPGIAGGCDCTQNNNERLIFQVHDVAGERSSRGWPPALADHAAEAAFPPEIPILNFAEASLCAGA